MSKKKKSPGAFVPAASMVVLLVLSVWASHAASLSSRAATGGRRSSLPAPTPASQAGDHLHASPCARALARGAVCVAANRRALEIMGDDGPEAMTVVQDVRRGALVAFAATRPSSLDVTTPVLPLSLSKLLLAASCWERRLPEDAHERLDVAADPQAPPEAARMSLHEMLVGAVRGTDAAGRRFAVALRRQAGTSAVLEDLNDYGLGPRPRARRDEKFWSAVSPALRARLTPAPARVSLSEESSDAAWGDALSIGEEKMLVTCLHVSRFLQAVGNGGLMLPPSALEERSAPRRRPVGATRVMNEETARRLQTAMRETVERGTAKGIAGALEGTGWRMGGKTGSGPGPSRPQDGWFAGLIFDPEGAARFTVATFVRRGGPGGGKAAEISARLARYVIAGESAGPVPSGQPQAASTSERQIRELDRAWAEAITKGDAAALGRLFDDDLVVTSGSGAIRDKAGEIKDAAGPPDPDFVWLRPFTTEDVRVRIYKDAAVVTGLARWGFRYKGQEVNQERRYTHLYVKRQGRWRIVAQQVSSNLYKKP